MNKTCDRCNIKIELNTSHCPLCGRCIDEDMVGKPQIHQNFPNDDEFQKNKKQAMRAIFAFLLLGNFLTIFCELFFLGTFTWSLHILVASALGFLGIILPIKNNWYLVNHHAIFYVMFSGYIIFLENYTNTFGWGTVYTIPLFALFFGVYNFVMVLSGRSTRPEYFLPMIILFLMATSTLIYTHFSTLPSWPSVAAFLSILSFIIVLIIFRSTKIGRVLAKKLHF